MSAKILPFTIRERPTDRRKGAGPMGAILFFTGVRYERLPDAPAARPSGSAKRPKRRAVRSS